MERKHDTATNLEKLSSHTNTCDVAMSINTFEWNNSLRRDFCCEGNPRKSPLILTYVIQQQTAPI